MWRWYSCLGRRGSGNTRYSGELMARQQEIQCSRRVWPPVLSSTFQYSFLENPPDRILAGHSLQGHKVLGIMQATLVH